MQETATVVIYVVGRVDKIISDKAINITIMELKGLFWVPIELEDFPEVIVSGPETRMVRR